MLISEGQEGRGRTGGGACWQVNGKREGEKGESGEEYGGKGTAKGRGRKRKGGRRMLVSGRASV